MLALLLVTGSCEEVTSKPTFYNAGIKVFSSKIEILLTVNGIISFFLLSHFVVDVIVHGG
jgi:hypothetical protein